MATTVTTLKPAEKTLLAELKKKSARFQPNFPPLATLLKLKYVEKVDSPKTGFPLYQVTTLGKSQKT